MKRASPRQNYHHGDLRSALLATGVRLLEGSGNADIGLREIAREVGVSATAVYRHFPDKDALLAALAETGFERLAAAQLKAAARYRNKAAAFRAIGRAYVRFALANPALFRIMTSHMHLTGANGSRGDNRAAALLRERIAELLPAAASEKRRTVTALQAWALVHGLAMLILGGQVPHDEALIKAVVDEFRPGETAT
jgi:AcrR family transcriptional regulator